MDEIRFVQEGDREFWYRLDRHLPQTEFEGKIRSRQGYVLLRDRRPVGLLRYNLFWDNTPFCTMLVVDRPFQGMGCGRKLMEHWEKDMAERGHRLLLLSTRADESAQHFYRRLGYRDCGGLVIGTPGEAQPTELFFAKAVSVPVERR